MDDIYWISVLFLDILPFLLKRKIIISLLRLWSVIFQLCICLNKIITRGGNCFSRPVFNRFCQDKEGYILKK